MTPINLTERHRLGNIIAARTNGRDGKGVDIAIWVCACGVRGGVWELGRERAVASHATHAAGSIKAEAKRLKAAETPFVVDQPQRVILTVDDDDEFIRVTLT